MDNHFRLAVIFRTKVRRLSRRGGLILAKAVKNHTPKGNSRQTDTAAIGQRLAGSRAVRWCGWFARPRVQSLTFRGQTTGPEDRSLSFDDPQLRVGPAQAVGSVQGRLPDLRVIGRQEDRTDLGCQEYGLGNLQQF